MKGANGKMKVRDLYLRALALLNEEEGRARVYKKNALALTNQLLAQCLEVENSLREAKGADKLEKAQSVEDFDALIIYDQNFVSAAMPYGLASLLCADEDKVMSNAMADEFDRIKKKYSVVTFEDITNAYA